MGREVDDISIHGAQHIRQISDTHSDSMHDRDQGPMDRQQQKKRGASTLEYYSAMKRRL